MLPTAPAGRGLTRAQRLRRRVGRTLAGAGCVEVISFPFVGDADFDAPRPARGRRAAGTPSGWRTRSPRRSRRSPRRCCPACSRPRPATSAAARPACRCSRPAPSRSRPTAAPAPILRRRLAARRRRAREARWRRSPTSRCTWRSCSSGERERAGWWGEGRQAGWADAVELVRDVSPTRSASRSRWVRPPGCRGTPAAAPSSGSASQDSGTPASCTRGSARRTACRRAPAAVEIDLDLLLRRAVAVAPAPEFSTYPVAKEDVALVVDDVVPAADVEAALREGAGELLESIRLFDVYTGDQVGAGQEVARVRAALPRPRPDAHRGRDRAPPATPRSPSPPSGPVPSSGA